MSDLSKINFGGTEYNIKDTTARTDVAKKVTASGGDTSNTKISSVTASTESFPVPAAGETHKTILGKVIKFFNDVKAFKNTVVTLNMISQQIINDQNKVASMAALFSVNETVNQLNRDFVKAIEAESNGRTFKAGVNAAGVAYLHMHFADGTIQELHITNTGVVESVFFDGSEWRLNGVMATKDDLPGRLYWGGTETINITTAGQFATGAKKITIPAGTYIIMGHATIPEGVNATGRIKLDINALYETQQSWYPSQYATEVNITTFKYFSAQTDITLSVRADKVITGIIAEVAAIRIN